MSRIRILPEAVANKIAAGEVVERPASVVKELLENALDAGAKTIRVETEVGGKRMIRVIDDGHGMTHDDALLAFERHATSKLRSADDLLSIATLGFRGEALPTIAAVSHLLLETRDEAEAEGTRIEFAGGKLINVKPAGLPPGTTISVADIFIAFRRGENSSSQIRRSWAISHRWSRTMRWRIQRSSSFSLRQHRKLSTVRQRKSWPTACINFSDGKRSKSWWKSPPFLLRSARRSPSRTSSRKKKNHR